MKEVTRLLNNLDRGERTDASELLPLIYSELRKLAASKMANEAPGQTLQPTALVHEAWLRVTGDQSQTWDSRAHFFGAAAEAMRRILIENARRKQARRHGGGQARLDIQDLELAAPASDEQLLAVDEALARFASAHPDKAELVKLRYFAGLTIEEAATVLKISEATAKRWWVYSRAWLFTELNTPEPSSCPSEK